MEIKEEDFHWVSDSGWDYLGISIEDEGDSEKIKKKKFDEIKQEIQQSIEIKKRVIVGLELCRSVIDAGQATPEIILQEILLKTLLVGVPES